MTPEQIEKLADYYVDHNYVNNPDKASFLAGASCREPEIAESYDKGYRDGQSKANKEANGHVDALLNRIADLKAENDRLRAEIERLKKMLIDMRFTDKENYERGFQEGVASVFEREIEKFKKENE